MKENIEIDGKEITVVGTAHISQESRKEVKNTVKAVEPDLVGVELDENRYKSLKGDSEWKELNLSEAIKEGKAPLLLVNILLSIYQRSLDFENSSKPGLEMLDAINLAKEKQIKYSLLDRDINETLKRAFSQLSLIEKLKLITSFLVGEEDVDIEKVKEGDLLDNLVSELQKEFPTLSKVFLEERNSYMAERLLEEDFEKAVVVVGAAHVDGLIKKIKNNAKYQVNDKKGISWTKTISYGLPAFIILGMIYSFYQIGFSTGIQGLKFWILSNGLLAMTGAMIARSHISTWIISFLAAPLTSLDPALGAGMVASYGEAKLHPPTVEEMTKLPELENYRDLWSNQAGIVLLTFFFVTVGSALATFLSAGFIATLIGL